MPRPLIKWKSFWLGILVLGFFGWAWVWSMEENLTLTPWDQSRLALSTGNGQLDVFVMVPDTLLDSAGVLKWRTPLEAKHWFPKPIESRTVDRIGEGTSVAHWFLILLFLVPWSACLAWRVRKQRRLTQADASAFSQKL